MPVVLHPSLALLDENAVAQATAAQTAAPSASSRCKKIEKTKGGPVSRKIIYLFRMSPLLEVLSLVHR